MSLICIYRSLFSCFNKRRFLIYTGGESYLLRWVILEISTVNITFWQKPYCFKNIFGNQVSQTDKYFFVNYWTKEKDSLKSRGSSAVVFIAAVFCFFHNVWPWLLIASSDLINCSLPTISRRWAKWLSLDSQCIKLISVLWYFFVLALLLSCVTDDCLRIYGNLSLDLHNSFTQILLLFVFSAFFPS